MNIKALKNRLLSSKLFKDSFWAVFGNGLGYGLMLVSGILIARLLGKDLYGEYGLIKTTLFQIAAFATFGLGYTSTRFVAKAKAENPEKLVGYIQSSFFITLVSSCLLAIILFIFAQPLAEFIEEPSIALSLRMLGVITVFKAVLTTQNGIFAGLGNFKVIARNNVFSAVLFLVTCIPMTLWFSVKGSLFALAFSQIFNVLLNSIAFKGNRYLKISLLERSTVIELITFSIPVALQELTLSASAWIISILIAKMTTLGELGIYSATSQWNTIILFIPGLLSNVVLSHLSSNVSNKKRHHQTVWLIVLVNLICTFLPFLIVYFSADYIQEIYGVTFIGIAKVLKVSVFSTIITCVGNVFNYEMISQGRNWTTLFLRSTRDIIFVSLVYYLLKIHTGNEGALQVAYAQLASCTFYLLSLYIFYLFYKKQN